MKTRLTKSKDRTGCKKSKLTAHDVLIKVDLCGVNPIDHMVISGAVPVKSLLYIPGCEISGRTESMENHVENDFKEEIE